MPASRSRRRPRPSRRSARRCRSKATSSTCAGAARAVWMPLGDLDFGVGYENHTSYPAPGQIILYPGGISETEILIAYGGVHFASKMGQLAGNHFITADLGPGESGRRSARACCGRARYRSASRKSELTDARYPRDLRGYGRNPPRSAMARRRAGRGAVRRQFRGGRREQHFARRSRLGSVPVRRARRAALAGPAPRQYRIDVRIWLARRLLAAVADVHRAQDGRPPCSVSPPR